MEDLDTKTRTIKESSWRLLVFVLIGFHNITILIDYYKSNYRDNFIWIDWAVLACCIYVCFDSIRDIIKVKKNKSNK